MAWRAITEADVLESFSGTELATFRALGLGTGESDPVAGIISGVTEYVRGFIRSVPLGASGTLPPSLIEPAVDLIVVKIQARAGGRIIDPNGYRKEAAKDAEKFLREMVATGELPMEYPTTLGDESIAGGLRPTLEGRYTAEDGRNEVRESEYGRENEDGV